MAPFFALMMLHNPGAGYVVWDKAGSIRYLKPGRGDVHAHFRLHEAEVERARRATARGGRHEPTFRVAIVDATGETVAEVGKTLYIRRHPEGAKAQRTAAAPARAAREHRSPARAAVRRA